MDTETLNVAQSVMNLESLEKLKGGSCRTVYRDGDKVVKVARNVKGLEQNNCAGDWYLINQGLLPKLIDSGIDYIVTENCPRNDKITRQFLKPLQKFSIQDFNNKTSELQDVLNILELETFMDYDVLWNDIISYRNWGINSEGKPILIDEGAITDKVHSYSKPGQWAIDEWEQVKRLRRINS